MHTMRKEKRKVLCVCENIMCAFHVLWRKKERKSRRYAIVHRKIFMRCWSLLILHIGIVFLWMQINSANWRNKSWKLQRLTRRRTIGRKLIVHCHLFESVYNLLYALTQTQVTYADSYSSYSWFATLHHN